MGGEGSGRKPDIINRFGNIKGVQGSRAIGQQGYDNPRENIDPHIKTQTVTSKQGTIQQTPTEEKDIVNKEYVDGVAGRSSISLFITEDASDIGGYFNLDANINITAEQNIAQSITAGSTTLIGSFASVLNESEIDAIELLESGIYKMHIHAKGASAKDLYIYYEFYKRAAGGTETLLGTSHDSRELTTSDTNYALHTAIASDTAWIPGDRVVVKVYGRNDGAANKTVTIYMEGTTAARVVFPGVIPFQTGGGVDGLWSSGAGIITPTTASQTISGANLKVSSQGIMAKLLVNNTGPTAASASTRLYSTSDLYHGMLHLDALATNAPTIVFKESGVADLGWLGFSGGSTLFQLATAGHLTSGVPRLTITYTGLVALGSTPAATSAKLDMQGTDGALLIPRMTDAQRTSLTPTAGMMIYNSSSGAFNFYEGTTWKIGSQLL